MFKRKVLKQTLFFVLTGILILTTSLFPLLGNEKTVNAATVGTQGDSVSNQYIRIKNDWLNLYLYEDNGVLKYGNVKESDQRSQWLIENQDGMQRIKNRATGDYISIAGVKDGKSPVKVIDVSQSSSADQWIITNLNQDGYKLIRNISGENKYLNVEDQLGYVQYSQIPTSWGSLKWDFEPVTNSAHHYVRIKNRYTGQYIYEDNGKVKYGTPKVDNPSSNWLIEHHNGYIRIRNRVTGHYITNENVHSYLDPLESSPVQNSWTSARWTMGYAGTNKDYVVFQNVWKPDQVIHVQDQTGYAQSSNIPSNWWSAQWELEDAPKTIPLVLPKGYVRLINVQTGQALYENCQGVVLYGNPDAKNERSQWDFETDGNHYLIKNRATGHYISIQNHKPYVQSLPLDNGTNANQWQIEKAPDGFNILIRSIAQPKDYLHIQDQRGYAQVGLRSIESGYVQWEVQQASAQGFISKCNQDDQNISTKVFKDPNVIKIINQSTHKYLYESDGKVLVGGPTKPRKHADEWTIEHVNGHERLKNKATGDYLVFQVSLHQLVLKSARKVEKNAEWDILQQAGFHTIKNVLLNEYLGVKNGSQTPIMTSHPLNWMFQKVEVNVPYQAENAFLTSGVSAKTTGANFSGKGYITGFENQGAKAIFAVNAPAAGKYNVAIRYSNVSHSAKHLSVRVNGYKPKNLAFKKTKDRGTWLVRNIKLSLRKGINTISLIHNKQGEKGLNIDSLLIKNSIHNAYRGATLPYTEYEAEDTNTNGKVIGPSRVYHTLASEASGRKAVELTREGNYISFVLTKPANALDIRYSIPDAKMGGGVKTPISIYADGKLLKSISLTSKYSWVYGAYPWSNDPSKGNPHRFYDETHTLLGKVLPAGTVIQLKKNKQDGVNEVIDLVDMGLVSVPYKKPAHFLSIEKFGARPNDKKDDTEAIKKTIIQAKRTDKGVWIPKGTFNIEAGQIYINNVTIRGSGPWYSTLKGGGFMADGNQIKIYDLSIDGDVTARHDSLPESGIDGTFGTGSIIQNVWIEHVKTGIWTVEKNKKVTNGLYVVGSRIRDTFADGINFNSGTKNSLVEQTELRNTGDDSLAMWANGEATVNNTFRFNTTQLPWLANNIAIYGGKDNHVEDNVIKDTIAFGSGITISTRFNPTPFSGTTDVKRNTLIRAGGREYNWNANFGAIWIYSGNRNINADIQIDDNIIKDSSYQGISFSGNKEISNVHLDDNIVDGTGTWGINAYGNISGSVSLDNTVIRNVKVGEFFNGVREKFQLKGLQ